MNVYERFYVAMERDDWRLWLDKTDDDAACWNVFEVIVGGSAGEVDNEWAGTEELAESWCEDDMHEF